MKIMNAGKADFVIRDKRGNLITLRPSEVTEIADQTVRKIRVYPFIKIVEEKKEEPKVEPKIEEPVVKKTKKKAKQRGLNGLLN